MMRRELAYGKGTSMMRREFDCGKGNAMKRRGAFYYERKFLVGPVGPVDSQLAQLGQLGQLYRTLLPTHSRSQKSGVALF